jgi:hypothetical protein
VTEGTALIVTISGEFITECLFFLSDEVNSWWHKFKREHEDESFWHFGSLKKSYHCVTNASVVAENYVERQWDGSTIIRELLLLHLKVKVPKYIERKPTF